LPPQIRTGHNGFDERESDQRKWKLGIQEAALSYIEPPGPIQ
jgi:hypothetical protein